MMGKRRWSWSLTHSVRAPWRVMVVDQETAIDRRRPSRVGGSGGGGVAAPHPTPSLTPAPPPRPPPATAFARPPPRLRHLRRESHIPLLRPVSGRDRAGWLGQGFGPDPERDGAR